MIKVTGPKETNSFCRVCEGQNGVDEGLLAAMRNTAIAGKQARKPGQTPSGISLVVPILQRRTGNPLPNTAHFVQLSQAKQSDDAETKAVRLSSLHLATGTCISS